ncbi:type VII secretion target [Amycolatopsis sp. OK19-0408]|uniref:Type VII secretion target n=1 Tax=Amycolatopsis iheyensis TaxID=2945988 RepID=A0A9X2SII1_9PSEU|nr:type VII secretion target [Amycolatopsis iheyensis]MCR6481255.1 type VII secretion target [Amycolatopsis iheyensis]
MDGYAVKAGELGKLIGDLDTAAGRMADANRKLGGGGAFGSLGTAELGKAGVEFEEAWRFGIGRLGEAASDITERLKAAKEKYERIEAQFAGEFGSAVGGGGAPGADPRDDGKVGGGVPGINSPEGRRGIGDLLDGDGR